MPNSILSKNTQPESENKDLKSMTAQENECLPVGGVSVTETEERYRIVRGKNGPIVIDMQQAREAVRHAMEIWEKNP